MSVFHGVDVADAIKNFNIKGIVEGLLKEAENKCNDNYKHISNNPHKSRYIGDNSYDLLKRAEKLLEKYYDIEDKLTYEGTYKYIDEYLGELQKIIFDSDELREELSDHDDYDDAYEGPDEYYGYNVGFSSPEDYEEIGYTEEMLDFLEKQGNVKFNRGK